MLPSPYHDFFQGAAVEHHLDLPLSESLVAAIEAPVVFAVAEGREEAVEAQEVSVVYSLRLHPFVEKEKFKPARWGSQVYNSPHESEGPKN